MGVCSLPWSSDEIWMVWWSLGPSIQAPAFSSFSPERRTERRCLPYFFSGFNSQCHFLGAGWLELLLFLSKWVPVYTASRWSSFFSFDKPVLRCSPPACASVLLRVSTAEVSIGLVACRCCYLLSILLRLRGRSSSLSQLSMATLRCELQDTSSMVYGFRIRQRWFLYEDSVGKQTTSAWRLWNLFLGLSPTIIAGLPVILVDWLKEYQKLST